MKVQTMHNPRRICAVTASRADYVKIKSVLAALTRAPGVELQIIVTGSHLLRNYDRTIELIRQDRFPISYTAYIEIDGRVPVTMAKSTGLGVSELATAFHNLEPDIVILHGDRYEILAAAVAASLMNIFIAHIEGGEVSGTIDEHIRHAITKFAHLHFPTTPRARDLILQLGERPADVLCVGCPGVDLLLKTEPVPLRDIEKIVHTRYTKEERKIPLENGFILCVQHPVTTEYYQTTDQICETLAALAEIGLPVLMLWPNIDAGADDISQAIRIFKLDRAHDLLHVFRNFPPEIFYNIIRHAAVMVGNSSAGIREAPYFGTPVVNIGTRQQGRAHGKNVMHAGYNRDDIVRAIRAQLHHGKYPPEQIYGDGGAGERIAAVLKTVDPSVIQKHIKYG
ncbi:UDP-N-acetylglucosamine 2-epimerase (hydrolyzing) [Candidatus Parcubacteria bacterium]|nr:UDP-N-acetylglucosamine 2-epimerase (hydrolyzing) [Candidatus Parcubacteria bacterium]